MIKYTVIEIFNDEFLNCSVLTAGVNDIKLAEQLRIDFLSQDSELNPQNIQVIQYAD